MSASIKHTIVRTVRRLVIFNQIVLIRKSRKIPKKQNNINLYDDNVAYTLYNVSSSSAPYKTNIIIDSKPESMEIDTGSAVTIMSKDVFYDHYHFSKVPMVKQSEEMTCTYTGEKIPIYGTVDVCVSAKWKSTELPLNIVSGSGPTFTEEVQS